MSRWVLGLAKLGWSQLPLHLLALLDALLERFDLGEHVPAFRLQVQGGLVGGQSLCICTGDEV